MNMGRKKDDRVLIRAPLSIGYESGVEIRIYVQISTST